MRVYEVESGRGKLPVGQTLPTVTMRAEGVHGTADADPGISDFDFVIASVVEARSAFTTTLALSSPEDLGEVVMQSHRAAIREKLIEQVVSGDGAGQNLSGIIGQTGIGSATFAAADRGKVAAILTAEATVEDADANPESLRWLEGSAHSTSTRGTLVEPGSFRRVVERERMTLSGVRAYRSNSAIASTSALLADWASIVLVVQNPIVVVVDRITRPGEVRITSRLAVADPVVTRPTRVYALTQA